MDDARDWTPEAWEAAIAGAATLADLLTLMRAAGRGHDQEENHVRADDILCRAIELLSPEWAAALIAAYADVDKWYA